MSVSLEKLGYVLATSGDLAGARKHFEESLAIARELSRSNPSSAAARRDVSVSLEKLGDVLAASGGPGRGAQALRGIPRDRA